MHPKTRPGPDPSSPTIWWARHIGWLVVFATFFLTHGLAALPDAFLTLIMISSSIKKNSPSPLFVVKQYQGGSKNQNVKIISNGAPRDSTFSLKIQIEYHLPRFGQRTRKLAKYLI